MIDPSLKLQVITSDTKRELCAHVGAGFESPTEVFLDLHTGKVVHLLADDALDVVNMDEEEEQIILKDLIAAEYGSRYLEVYTLNSDETYNGMKAFVLSSYSKEAKDSLAAAISLRKPFRQFQNVLLEYPKIRETWFVFEQEFQFMWLKTRYLAEFEVELVDEETTLDTH